MKNWDLLLMKTRKVVCFIQRCLGTRTLLYRYCWIAAKLFLESTRRSRNVLLHLFRRNRNYRRFVLLCRSRTGSSLLVSLLDCYRGIRCLGELFGAKSVLSNTWIMSDPIDYIRRAVYRNRSRVVEAVGFKLFYTHAHEELVGGYSVRMRKVPVAVRRRLEKLWIYLQRNRDVSVIHLKRRNRLRTFVSWKIARRDRIWHSTSDQSAVRPIRLDPDECVRDFRRTQEWETEFARFFCKHPVLDVFYEDLQENPASELRRITAFLGVSSDVVTLQSNLRKQNTRTLPETIENFSEVADALRGTEWERFLVE